MIKSKQLVLNLRLDDHSTFDNFLVGDNQELVNYLRIFCLQDVTNQSENFIYLCGPSCSGRTHLLHACCNEITKQERTCFYLSLQHLNKINPKILEDLENISLICLDDIQNVSNRPEWEQAVFNLFNLLVQNKKKILITADVSPQLLPITLPDLKSRLSCGLSLAITPLTDEQKLTALRMRANKRGLNFPETAGKYLLHRYARDTRSLFVVLDKIDKESLILQHKITIPFIKNLLAQLECD